MGPGLVLQGLGQSWGKSWWRWGPWFSSLLSPRSSGMVQLSLIPLLPPLVLLPLFPVSLLLHLLREFLKDIL